MKKVFVKGHPLTENELKEVKGGSIYVIKVVNGNAPDAFSCEDCGNRIYMFDYNADKKLYYAMCNVCGCRNEVRKEE